MTSKPVPVRVAPTISNAGPAAPGQKLSEAPPPASRSDVANYIGTLAQSLEQLARAHDLKFLAYLLSMIVEEARAVMAAQAASHSPSDTATR